MDIILHISRLSTQPRDFQIKQMKELLGRNAPFFLSSPFFVTYYIMDDDSLAREMKSKFPGKPLPTRLLSVLLLSNLQSARIYAIKYLSKLLNGRELFQIWKRELLKEDAGYEALGDLLFVFPFIYTGIPDVSWHRMALMLRRFNDLAIGKPEKIQLSKTLLEETLKKFPVYAEKIFLEVLSGRIYDDPELLNALLSLIYDYEYVDHLGIVNTVLERKYNHLKGKKLSIPDLAAQLEPIIKNMLEGGKYNCTDLFLRLNAEESGENLVAEATAIGNSCEGKIDLQTISEHVSKINNPLLNAWFKLFYHQ